MRYPQTQTAPSNRANAFGQLVAFALILLLGTQCFTASSSYADEPPLEKPNSLAKTKPKAKPKGQATAADNVKLELAGAQAEIYKRASDYDLYLYLFYPAGHQPRRDQRPAAVFFFGGGWTGGSPAQFQQHAQYLASRGMVAAVADYRVRSRQQTTPKECVADGKSVVRYLRANAARLGIDANRIAAGGGSAGGHVAAAAGTLPGLDDPTDDKSISARPNALLLFNPVYDNGPEGGWSHAQVSEYWHEISPAANIDAQTPPAIVFLGEKDALIPVATAQRFQQKMRDAGVKSDLHLYPGQAHGFFNESKGGSEIFRDTLSKMDEFLVGLGYLSGEPTAAQIEAVSKPNQSNSATKVEPNVAPPQPLPLRVFIFAGQSNMVGTHSRVADIQRFPPFAGLDKPQDNVLFSYKLGREQMETSDGWIPLQPTGDYFGPEVSFGKRVSKNIEAPIAIIKCASGGTTLGQDWNPDVPGGFKLYPLTLEHVRAALAELDRKKVAYQLEGFMWHQGENDMFSKEFKPNYAANLKNFIASWRRDLKTPDLKFYIGELCTKTIWGMDNRDNMLAIRMAQKAVTAADPLALYVPTSHDAVEIGGDQGLHYHYGTLGQLEHGINYADAYLRTVEKTVNIERPLKEWPYAPGSPVKLFIMAGHRNMEGERAFTQELKTLQGHESLADDNVKIAFRYSLGGGFKTSAAWEPLGPAGAYETFGPELSFANTLQSKVSGNIAIAKFTHSGSQVNDWTPEGTVAKDMNMYTSFIAFIQSAMRDLKDKGHPVELAGIVDHIGENDMAYYPYRKDATKWLHTTVVQSRLDLELPALKWYVSQQSPPDEKGLNRIDITANLAAMAAEDPAFIHIKAFDLPEQREKLVLDTAGVVALGEVLARGYVEHP